jgi:preprotein translocase subunit YajC
MWVLFILPQRRRQAAQRHMLTELEVGDEIVTVGGLLGYVRGLDEDEVVLEIAPGTNVRLARRAVAAVVPPEDDEPDEEPAEPASERQSEPIEAEHR